eukprot:4279394-Prymnesium_polylepis.1
MGLRFNVSALRNSARSCLRSSFSYLEPGPPGSHHAKCKSCSTSYYEEMPPRVRAAVGFLDVVLARSHTK